MSSALRTFLGDPTALANGIAYSDRAIGNISRPFFPDGIGGTANGPFSKPLPQWSIFNDGLQLDLVQNKLVASLVAGDDSTGCTGVGALANGIQIFAGQRAHLSRQRAGRRDRRLGRRHRPGRHGQLPGLANAATILGAGIANAPAAIRADTLVPQGEGTRLRYVNCPQAPFNGSSQQNVCAGI